MPTAYHTNCDAYKQLIFTLGPQEVSQDDDPSNLGQTFRTTVADTGQALGLYSELGL